MIKRQLLYVKPISSRRKSLGLNPIQTIKDVVFLDEISLLSHTTLLTQVGWYHEDQETVKKASRKMNAECDTLANCSGESIRLGILFIQSVSILNWSTRLQSNQLLFKSRSLMGDSWKVTFSEYRLNVSGNTLNQIQSASHASLCLFSPEKLS